MANSVVYCRVTPQELIDLNTRAALVHRSRNNYVTVVLAGAMDGEHAPGREVETVPANEAVALFLRLPPELKAQLIRRAGEAGLSVNRYIRGVLF